MNLRLLSITLILSLLSLHVRADIKTGTKDYDEDVYFILSGEADRAIADGDYATAVMRIKEALNVDPSNPSNVLLLSNLGLMYNYLDRDSLALEAFNHAHRIAPSMTTVIENRAMLYLKTGDDAAAYDDLSTVLERDSLNVNALFYHGMLSLGRRDIDTASADFRKLQSQDPEGHNTIQALALLNATLGKYTDAIPYYKKLVEDEPLDDYYCGLALCQLSTDRLSEASATIAQAMQLYPDSAELYYYRAWLNRERYLLDDARRDAAKAVALGADPKALKALLDKK